MARAIANSWEGRASRRLRKKVEMLFAHLKRILKMEGCDSVYQMVREEFVLAATAQNLSENS